MAAVARAAVASGADLLGVAGGDGTQALVAEVAAEHGLPFMVITAGTRNHFALDLGLDRDDPAACLAALSDGVDLRVDLGVIGGRVFVNNASFGAYAEIVETPAYRGDKLGTTLDVLPSLLQGQRGARLAARADDAEITAPQALLVSNNQYGSADVAGLNRRVRLDGGVLGVVGVTVSTANEAVRLLRGSRSGGLTMLTAKEVTVTADTPQIPVGVDGEAVSLPTPVVCSIRPGALRVRVPRNRPGATPPEPPVNFSRLRRLALLAVVAGRRGRVTGAYERVTSLAELFARVGELALATLSSTSSRWWRPGTAASRGSIAAWRRFSARPRRSRRCGRWSSRPTPPGARRFFRPPRPPRPPAGRAGRRRRPAGRVRGLGGQAAADRAVSRPSPAGGRDRRPAADRRDTRVPPWLPVPALRPALRPRADRAPAHAPLGPGRPPGPVRTAATAVAAVALRLDGGGDGRLR